MKNTITLAAATVISIGLIGCSGGPERIAFMNNEEISVMNANGMEKVQLTSDGHSKISADWSADEKMIVFDSEQDGDTDIFTMKSDGSEITQLTSNNDTDFLAYWSPNGNTIVFSSDRDGDFEIFTMNADGTEVYQITTNDEEIDLPDSS